MDEHFILNSQSDLAQFYINTNSDNVNNKYISSEEKNINNINNNIIGTIDNNYSEIKEEEFEESPTKIKTINQNSRHISEIENLPLKINSKKEKEKDNINNLIINDSISKSPDDSAIEHYMKMENLYLQDGKVNTTLTNNIYSSNNTVKNSTPNFLETKRNSEIIQLNEEKLKNLVKKINNHEDIKNFEINDNSEINISSNKEYSESYKEYNQEYEIRQKIRNEKQNKIREEISNELRPKLFNEIYQKQYMNIFNIIKNEIEKELKDDLNSYFNDEINEFKKKQNIILMEKEAIIGNNMREQCENEMEIELFREIDLKEREYNLKFNKAIESFKKKIENDFNKKYEKKKQDLTKEINEIKSEIYRAKSNEKLKINKINTLKNNIKLYNEQNHKIIESLDKLFTNKDLDNINNPSYSNRNRNNKNLNVKKENFNKDLKNDNSYSNDMNNTNKLNKSKNIDDLLINSFDSNKFLARNSSINSVNLKEINQQIRLNTGKSCKNLMNRKYLNNDSSNILLKNYEPINEDNPINLKKEIINNNNNIVSNNEENNLKSFLNISTKNNNQIYPIQNLFYSIQIENNIPMSVSAFGEYLMQHIQKEEEYKNLYNNEFDSFYNQIIQILNSGNTEKDILINNMIDLWNKLQISYYTRYQIMKQLIKLHPSNLNSFLERENEYLNYYYQITEKIFRWIQNRENLKLKLQTQLNNDELNDNDTNEFNDMTNLLDDLIEQFKLKYKNLDIIWKGLRYQWFMNYENWFYDMENL